MSYTGKHAGALWNQWTFEGDWTEHEIAEMEAFLKRWMTPQSGYPWTISKCGTGFMAKRDHWDIFAFKSDTLADLEGYLSGYYETYEGI